jgi:hypothetical protein
MPSSLQGGINIETSERSVSRDRRNITAVRFKFTSLMQMVVDTRRFTCPMCLEPVMDAMMCSNVRCVQLYCKTCLKTDPRGQCKGCERHFCHFKNPKATLRAMLASMEIECACGETLLHGRIKRHAAICQDLDTSQLNRSDVSFMRNSGRKTPNFER